MRSLSTIQRGITAGRFMLQIMNPGYLGSAPITEACLAAIDSVTLGTLEVLLVQGRDGRGGHAYE